MPVLVALNEQVAVALFDGVLVLVSELEGDKLGVCDDDSVADTEIDALGEFDRVAELLVVCEGDLVALREFDTQVYMDHTDSRANSVCDGSWRV